MRLEWIANEQLVTSGLGEPYRCSSLNSTSRDQVVLRHGAHLGGGREGRIGTLAVWKRF